MFLFGCVGVVTESRPVLLIWSLIVLLILPGKIAQALSNWTETIGEQKSRVLVTDSHSKVWAVTEPL